MDGEQRWKKTFRCFGKERTYTGGTESAVTQESVANTARSVFRKSAKFGNSSMTEKSKVMTY